MPHPKIDVFGDRGQCITMLLAVLSQMGAIRAKQDVLAYIQAHHFFEIRPDDWIPYPTQTEPKWHTMIAWARKDCVMREWMFNHDERDFWEITGPGLSVFQKLQRKFQNGELQVRRCFLWSAAFKKMMCPDYVPSSQDTPRPCDVVLCD